MKSRPVILFLVISCAFGGNCLPNGLNIPDLEELSIPDVKELDIPDLEGEDCGDLKLNDVKPDPKNCSQFIQCAPEGLVTLPCPKDLLFNPKTLLCDYPENVQCATEIKLNLNEDNEPCDIKDLDKLRPDTDCSRFDECTLSGWVSMPCPDGLKFNPQTLLCDYPENVKCATEFQNASDDDREPCPISDLDKLKPDTKNCSQYYECNGEFWQSMPCPEDLKFNPLTLQCDFPENVKCATEFQFNLGEDIEPCDIKDLGKLKPDTKNCSSYYECNGVNWENMPCPTDLKFNPQTLLCDYPENVKCATDFQNNLDVDIEPCPISDLDKLIPNPEDCTTFFECALAGWVLMPCPTGLYFNPDTLQCDLPQNVNCTSTIYTR